MIYLECGDKVVIILETENIEEIKKGKPLVTPGENILVTWTPDPVWLAGKIMDADGDIGLVAVAIDESQKRPQASLRQPHSPEFVVFKQK